ncbi:MAG TPA: YchJ family metal-binding protein [Myxococcales bacterium]|nr:YchJ family metal-binding protein [Myxococcales bacterium]
MAAEDCPCGSGRKLRACCRPFHDGGEPPDPEALMRSRFSAFALGDAEYLWRTLHSAHLDRGREEREFTADLRRSRQALRFVRLQVLDRRGEKVLFHAEIYERGKERSYLELSTFERDAQVAGAPWRYLSGQLRMMKAGDPSLAGMTIATCRL